MPREMRRVSGLIFRILTSTESPGLTKSDGFATRCQAISVTCSSPSPPPRSTNAPKSVTLRTVPRRIAPSPNSPNSLLARLLFLFLKNCPAIHNDVFVRGVQLDNLALDILADQFLKVGLFLGAAARCGKKRGNADIHAQAALHHLGDTSGYGAVFSESSFQSAPVLGAFHSDGGKGVGSFPIAAGDGDQHLIAHVNGERAGLVAKQFHGKNAVDFAANIHEDGFRRNGNHRTSRLRCSCRRGVPARIPKGYRRTNYRLAGRLETQLAPRELRGCWIFHEASVHRCKPLCHNPN